MSTDTPEIPALPEGATLLTAKEAIVAILTGDHPDTSSGSVAADLALVANIRDGYAEVARMPNRSLVFRPTQKLIDEEIAKNVPLDQRWPEVD
jgi:hypothetical protein